MECGRWLPTANDFEMDLLIPAAFPAAGTRLASNYAFMVLVFEGCSPSTQIGQIYVTSAASFKPPANLVGLYDVKVRGSYQGTHRIIHQLRKRGVMVNFDPLSDLRKYIVANYS